MKVERSNLYGYNKKLKILARGNRNAATKAEACLWKYVLRARQMNGYQFRRQRPVVNYIADFMCKELMLIIEVDGITHDYSEAVTADEQRLNILEEAGFTVLRFDNDEVLNHINSVRYEIEKWIENYER